ncbi:MAG: hypothetical protein IPI97_08090 [Nitrosomonas sp.]|nr:hypothetical protein [Nitrosomonas sp.]
MPNYALLQAKIVADHAADTAEQISAALNAKTIATKQPISTADIKKYLLLNGVWLAIKTSANPVAVTAMDALALFEAFNVQESNVQAMLVQIMDGLIAANLTPAFTATHKAAVLAMGDTLVSWADQHWEGAVQLWQINEVQA